MHLVRALNQRLIRLDRAGSRTAAELWSDSYTSKRFLWNILTEWVGGEQTGRREPEIHLLNKSLLSTHCVPVKHYPGH